MLSPDSQSRIKISDIFEHPWVLGYQKRELEKLKSANASPANTIKKDKPIESNSNTDTKNNTNKIKSDNRLSDEKDKLLERLDY